MQSATQTLDISVNNLTVTYSNAKLALYNANCTIEPGSITALVGPNGGGKSTLFKSIMGFLKPSQGQIRIGGISVQKAQKRQLMAYVPQSDEVDWNFPVSVFDVVMMGRYGYMNLLRIPSAKDRRLVMESLERVGMIDFRTHQIGELSGGQKKRAFLARALAQEGKVILLDEPFTGVDVKTEKTHYRSADSATVRRSYYFSIHPRFSFNFHVLRSHHPPQPKHSCCWNN